MTEPHAWRSELRRRRLRRGWSLEDVASELRGLAPEVNLGVDARMVGRWERGERQPRAPYPKLLALLYDCSAEELGLCSRVAGCGTLDDDMRRRELLRLLSMAVAAPALQLGKPVPEAMAALEGPARVHGEGLEVIETSIANCRRIDDLFGSRVAAQPALAQWRLVVRLLQGSHGEALHQRLCSAGSQVAHLLGWVAYDMNDPGTARGHFRQALRLAHEARDDALAAYILGYLSVLERDDGDQREALAFAEAARGRARGAATSTCRSWHLSVEAEALANLGDRTAAERALDRAETELAEAKQGEDPPWIYYHDRANVVASAGRCYSVLGLPTAARRAIEETIASTQASMVRDQALHLTRLANTYVPEGEIEEACRLAGKAVTVASETTSDRALKRVRELRSELQPWDNFQAVRELDDRLAAAGSF